MGGGHTHALVLKSLGMKPLNGARLTLISPAPTAPYTGMLPGYIAGHYTQEELNIDLFQLARFAGARLVLGEVVSIAPGARVLTTRAGRDVHYDIASIDVGITSNLSELPGFAEFAIPAKPLGPFAKAWENLVNEIKKHPRDPSITIIGGGVAGVEIALAMKHRLTSVPACDPKVLILEKSNSFLSDAAKKTQNVLLGALHDQQIELQSGVDIRSVAKGSVHLEGGKVVTSDFTVGAAGAQPHPWIADTHLELDNGFIQIDEFLRSTNDPSIFATGDCAHMAKSPRPKAGVFAVRQAPYLLRNIRAELEGGPFSAYQPQDGYLKLISMGDKTATADKFGLTLTGKTMWHLKNYIDKKFMNQFEKYPKMEPREHDAGAIESDLATKLALAEMCGGCGSKVPASLLQNALNSLEVPKNNNVVTGAGDDAAVIRHSDAFQIVTTDHLRAFTLDPYLLTQTAIIHALGDIWAMGGAPHSILSSVTVPPSSSELQANTLQEIFSAVQKITDELGIDVIGGHTSVGAELTIGCTAIGFSHHQPIGQNGAKPGDAIVLTKPIGMGVILAAEMQSQAKGEWIEKAYRQLVTPQGTASNLLKNHATAMTDVTGFGLAGHLALLMRGSNKCANLICDTIPVLDGALELARQGIRSSLLPSNVEFVTELATPKDPFEELLFDPQTSGGLLATIPEEHVNGILEQFETNGIRAVVIGNVTDGPTNIRLEK